MRALLLCVGAALLVLAGCSGGDDEGADRLSKDEYVRQADAICEDYERRLDELGDPQSIRDLGRLAGEARPIAQEGVAKLKELKPPEELEPEVDEWLELNDLSVRRIGELGEAAGAGDEDRVQEIARDAAADEERADDLAREIGLKACASAD